MRSWNTIINRRFGKVVTGTALSLLACASFGFTSLQGPAKYLPQKLEGEIFYVPVAQGTDQKLIKNAKSNGLKINNAFFTKYHSPLVAAVRAAAKHRKMAIGDQVNLFGWLVIATHKMNGVGYLWGGDLGDNPKDSWSTSGVGFDCSGFVWSVWEAIAPQSVFANCGERVDSSTYRQFGRQVIPPSPANKAFLDKLRKYARPGDVIIMKGHICLYGYDPRTKDEVPIVMENGQFWNGLDKWLERYPGKVCEVRSAFSKDGNLYVTSKRSGRELPPLAPTKPDRSLLIASADELTKDAKKKKSEEEVQTTIASAEAESENQESSEDDRELDKVDENIRQVMSEVQAFDIASLPPPSAKKKGPNHKPAITKVLTRGPQLPNDKLEFGVATEDEDYDDIVEYRIRMYGAENWTVSDSPYFRTAVPGFTGEAILEFQVKDARGATSKSSYHKLVINEPGTAVSGSTPKKRQMES